MESRGIDFVGYVFRHDYIRVRKGIKNSCRKRIRHSNNLAGILPSYFGWFQHCNAVNLKRTILDEVDAYLLTYIYDKITQVFYKHKDNKE